MQTASPHVPAEPIPEPLEFIRRFKVLVKKLSSCKKGQYCPKRPHSDECGLCAIQAEQQNALCLPYFRDECFHFPCIYRQIQTSPVIVQVSPSVSQMPQ